MYIAAKAAKRAFRHDGPVIAMTTPLAGKLKQQISKEGAISLAAYMRHLLTDHDYGYYVTRSPLGVAGDFITAPEISQIFGELIGVWIAAIWQKIPPPTSLNLVEMGPGRATLMGDILRTFQKIVPELTGNLRLHMIEISPVLKTVQQERISRLYPDIACDWHQDLSDLPDDGPFIFIGNEFFDSLPVHQLDRKSVV